MNEIHFLQLFKGNKTVFGESFNYPQPGVAELERWLVTLPPQSVGDWHRHEVPEFFFVRLGKLYVVNQRAGEKPTVNVFNSGEHGVTDCHISQFIWNPSTTDEVIVEAIYLGCKGKNPTKKTGGKPSQELLDKLLQQTIARNSTEENNLADQD
ncbi:MAG: hypothetical protein KIT27_01790 [Legionellales bacterium]|nr:hypothetical protein [Legionellales bacterium]